MKPEQTANEWKRVLKPGGYIVFSFSYNKTPTESDPVGGIKLENVKDLLEEKLFIMINMNLIIQI